MPKLKTVSLALVEADAAIAVLESSISNKLTGAERSLLVKAREALAVAEGRVNDLRSAASQLADGL